MRALMDRAGVPGLAAAIVRRGKVDRVYSYGLADAAARTPVRSSTIFETASISKIVTGVCAMQLVEQGKADLDEDVSAMLPFAVKNPRFPKEPITLRMLLSHASGIRDDPDRMTACTARGDPATPLGDFLRGYLAPSGPRADAGACFFPHAPGKIVRYSNVGVSLAALAVETRAKQPFSEYSRERVFEPLDMRDAAWRLEPLDRSRVALPHRWTGSGFAPTGHVGHAVYPVVDLRATAEDVGNLVAALAAGGARGGARILRSESLDAMLRPHFPELSPSQGLVLQRVEIGGRVVWGHEGEDEGATTMAFFDPKTGAGAVVLANGDAFASGDADRAKAMQEILAALLDEASR
jgi:CubicO group peptidase (beta-lactamase class C family)